MAANDVDKKMRQGNAAGLRHESCMLLSTTYPLNSSDTKRIQVGLRASIDKGIFAAVIKIMGNTASGVCITFDSWGFFKESMDIAGAYLRWTTKETPAQQFLNNIVVTCTTAYGARAVMVTEREKIIEGASEDISRAPKPVNEDTEPAQPPAKKRKPYAPSIVMQRVTLDGFENIVKCIDARLEQLYSLVHLVNECKRFLISEIELNLPRKITVDEVLVKQTIASKYTEIEENVRRQLQDLQFIDIYFDIVFKELLSLYLNDIIHSIIINAASS